MGSFATSSEPETGLSTEFNIHVFEIRALLRVLDNVTQLKSVHGGVRSHIRTCACRKSKAGIVVM
jgi:hypothetical protein